MIKHHVKEKEKHVENKIFAVPQYTTADEIKDVRRQFDLTQAELARFLGCSRPTAERWERSTQPITGPIVLLIFMMQKYPEDILSLIVPPQDTNLRVWYMFKHKPCTLIDVDELNHKVKIRNFTDNVLFRAFGRNEKPDFEEYENFLESRCFPRERDKMKLILAELNLPFYEPIMIIEKTQGRMAEDDFWLKVEWKKG